MVKKTAVALSTSWRAKRVKQKAARRQNATLTCRRLTQKRATARFAVALEGAET
jgi:hypothetical protein